MTDEVGHGRITVSQDLLRAELSQLELRLVDRITEMLRTKADQGHVDEIDKRLTIIELHGSQASLAANEDITHIKARLEILENAATGTSAVATYRKAFAAATIAAVGLLVAIVAVIVNGYGG